MSGRLLEDDGAVPRHASPGDTIDDGSAANGSGTEDANPHGALRRPRHAARSWSACTG